MTGEELDPGAVVKSRKEDVKFFRDRRVHTKVPRQQCYGRTGKAPIPVRWVDHNKGDKKYPTTDAD